LLACDKYIPTRRERSTVACGGLNHRRQQLENMRSQYFMRGRIKLEPAVQRNCTFSLEEWANEGGGNKVSGPLRGRSA
jgi:hypothetical protein